MENRNFSHTQAVAVINAALQSKAISLLGPTGTEQGSKESAENDATYLLTLLHRLSGQGEQGQRP